MNKCLMTDMADANELQRAIRPTGFFNIKIMAADFCSAQCIMGNTGSLRQNFLLYYNSQKPRLPTSVAHHTLDLVIFGISLQLAR